ncbi:MAG: 3-isopropylmalate dehydratase small subunit [Myxococcales bacterium]|nr:3-isopropylmalate dehydratase small subunit [Myxococcales bacterium]
MTSEPFVRIESRAVALPIDNIDTDQIIPARFLKGTVKEGLGAELFADWRYDETGAPREEFVLNRPENQGVEILVAGYNFGCGSSREHAPWALRGFGFRAVIAAKFADIFYNNALKNGLLPVELGADAVGRIAERITERPLTRLIVDLESQQVRIAEGAETFPFEIDAFARHCLLAGVDELGYLLAQAASIRAFEERHPATFDTRNEHGQEG